MIVSYFEFDVDGFCGYVFVSDAGPHRMHLPHDHLSGEESTVIMVATSSFCRSGSISFFILAISYMYWIGILHPKKCPGTGVNFYFPVAFLRNQLVSGGFILNLKLLSVKAVSLTLRGTSPLIWVVILLNYSQNFIMLMPRGPRD